MPKEYKIPFTTFPDGEVHMEEYPHWNHQDWRDNLTFKADLEITSSYRGRSAARVRVKNLLNGEHYSMGFGSFVDACQFFHVNRGKIVGGSWTFRKQGSNYGLVPVKVEKPKLTKPRKNKADFAKPKKESLLDYKIGEIPS